MAPLVSSRRVGRARQKRRGPVGVPGKDQDLWIRDEDNGQMRKRRKTLDSLLAREVCFTFARCCCRLLLLWSRRNYGGACKTAIPENLARLLYMADQALASGQRGVVVRRERGRPRQLRLGHDGTVVGHACHRKFV